MLSGYRVVSEVEDVLKSEYHKTPLGYNNVDWFVDEIIRVENKTAFYFKNTNKDIVKTEDDEEDYRNNIICRFCEKENVFDKFRDHCHLTGIYRGPAHNNCKINVKQNDSNFIPFNFHTFSNYDCHMFFKKLVDEKNDEVNFYIIPETNEEYISVTYGCITFIDRYRFLSSSLDSLVKTLVAKSRKTLTNLKVEIVDNDEFLDIVMGIEKEDRTIKDIKKDYPEEIKNWKKLYLIIWEKIS